MDKEKIESTKANLDTHKHYMEALGRIQNMLKKNKISVKKVKLNFFLNKSLGLCLNLI